MRERPALRFRSRVSSSAAASRTASDVPGLAIANPIDTPTSVTPARCSPSLRRAFDTFRSSRSRIRSGAVRGESTRVIANSSPPTLAGETTSSPMRTLLRRTRPMRISARSPTWCPCVSLSALKLSTSARKRTSRSVQFGTAAMASITLVTSRWSALRLFKPVNGSRSASSSSSGAICTASQRLREASGPKTAPASPDSCPSSSGFSRHIRHMPPVGSPAHRSGPHHHDHPPSATLTSDRSDFIEGQGVCRIPVSVARAKHGRRGFGDRRARGGSMGDTYPCNSCKGH